MSLLAGLIIYPYVCDKKLKNYSFMPTLFIIFGLRFYFYSDEHLPIHVHIESSDGKAKVNVDPHIEVVSNNGIKPRDLKKALVIIETYKDDIIDKWKEYHGE